MAGQLWWVLGETVFEGAGAEFKVNGLPMAIMVSSAFSVAWIIHLVGIVFIPQNRFMKPVRFTTMLSKPIFSTSISLLDYYTA